MTFSSWTLQNVSSPKKNCFPQFGHFFGLYGQSLTNAFYVKFGVQKRAGKPIHLLVYSSIDQIVLVHKRSKNHREVSLPYDDNAKAPELYPVERPVEPIAGPLETAAEEDWPQFGLQYPEEAAPEEVQPGAEKTKQRSHAFPIALGIFLLIAVWVLIPKKPKKRNRRERPKMNWDVE
jgi:hypothetical protein